MNEFDTLMAELDEELMTLTENEVEVPEEKIEAKIADANVPTEDLESMLKDLEFVDESKDEPEFADVDEDAIEAEVVATLEAKEVAPAENLIDELIDEAVADSKKPKKTRTRVPKEKKEKKEKEPKQPKSAYDFSIPMKLVTIHEGHDDKIKERWDEVLSDLEKSPVKVKMKAENAIAWLYGSDKPLLYVSLGFRFILTNQRFTLNEFFEFWIDGSKNGIKPYGKGTASPQVFTLTRVFLMLGVIDRNSDGTYQVMEHSEAAKRAEEKLNLNR
jgi:hypothetical protein